MPGQPELHSKILSQRTGKQKNFEKECMYVCLCVFMCTICVQVMMRPEDVSSIGTGVTGCELPAMGARNQSRSSARIVSAFNH